MSDELILQLEDEPGLELELGDGAEPLELQLGDAVAGVTNYEVLRNKPQINSRTLVGNMSVAEILADGLILDGGTAEEVAS